MKQTGHPSVSVVRRYIRDAELLDDNAAAGISLRWQSGTSRDDLSAP